MRRGEIWIASAATDARLLRLSVESNEGNGRRWPCHLMVDKSTAVAKTKLGSRIGRLDDHAIVRLNRAMLGFLGLAGMTPTASRPRCCQAASA